MYILYIVCVWCYHKRQSVSMKERRCFFWGWLWSTLEDLGRATASLFLGKSCCQKSPMSYI